MSFLAKLVSDNSKCLEKLELGHHPSQPPLRKLHGVRVLVRGYLHVRFDRLCSINFRDISVFPELWPITLIRGHPRETKVVVWILPV